MNSGNTTTAHTVTLAANSIVEKCLLKLATEVTEQIRDKLIDIMLAVLSRDCEEFDGESVRRHIIAEVKSTPLVFELEKRVAAPKTPKTSKTPKTKVVDVDADGAPVKKVRAPKEHKAPKEKSPKEPKPVVSDEEREAAKAAKQAEKEAAKAAKEAEKEAAKAASMLAKPAKEQRLPIPWCGARIPNRCEALRAYHGLFAQCTSDATEISAFCPSCEKSNAPFGTCAMRSACGLFDYTDPKGKKCVRLANVVDKFEVEDGIDAFIAEAAKYGITIPAEHLEKEVKMRGRPKSSSPRARPTKIATSDTGSGSETETDDEEHQAAAKKQQRKKVTKTASAASAEDAAPKKRGRPAKPKETAPAPVDDLISDLVASAKKSSTPVAAPAPSSPELSEDEVVQPVTVAPKPKLVAPKPKPAKVERKVVEIDGEKFWVEQYNGAKIIVRCDDNMAFDASTGDHLGEWDNKQKTVIECADESDEE